MPNAKIIAALGMGTLTLGACNKQQPQDQNISIDAGVPDNQVSLDNAQIETLPADESSSTPSNELANGFDNPNVNDLGNGNSH